MRRKRAKTIAGSTRSSEEIAVDCFAGGGGTSLGVTWALGRPPDIAINHDASAIEMHKANHPETKHYTEDATKVDPRQVAGGRPVGLYWASPDCKHFSRAKGGKPVEKKIRSLAWEVIRWAVKAPPRVIVLENVREFEDWGPLLPLWECSACQWKGTEGQASLGRRGRRKCPRCDSSALKETALQIPDPSRKGLTFKRWAGRLRNLGYEVQWKTLNAADFGAPTHRRRLFLIARNDGAPIVWPEPTHGDPKKIGNDLFSGNLKPWRTAAECIDWSVPCPSIFDRKKPLAEATMRRIAMGIKRYVLENPKPFIVRFRGDPSSGPLDIDAPLPTITAGSFIKRPAGAGHALGIATPYMVRCNHGGEHFRGQSVEDPLCTLTASRDAHGIVAPFLARISQTGGNGKYANSVDEPLTTIVSKNEHLVVSPLLISGYGERDGQVPRSTPATQPLNTVVATPKHHLVAAFLSRQFGKSVGTDLNEPKGASTAIVKDALIAAFLAKHYGGVVGHGVDLPTSTITAWDHHSLVAANLVHLNRGDACSSCDEPMRTVTATGLHAALVYSFLTKYFGTAVGQSLDDPLHTATGKDRFGLVTVTLNGEPWIIVDIGMRMLKPRELARGQGFPDDYALTGSQTNQVSKIGNSVSPQMAEAIVRANYVAAKARATAG
jgi:DNA (cytosine-5)-methyltransferase 1